MEAYVRVKFVFDRTSILVLESIDDAFRRCKHPPSSSFGPKNKEDAIYRYAIKTSPIRMLRTEFDLLRYYWKAIGIGVYVQLAKKTARRLKTSTEFVAFNSLLQLGKAFTAPFGWACKHSLRFGTSPKTKERYAVAVAACYEVPHSTDKSKEALCILMNGDVLSFRIRLRLTRNVFISTTHLGTN